MGSDKSSTAAGRRFTFLLGVAGTVLVFAGFYLRNPRPIHDHVEDFGWPGALVAGTCLLAISVGGGLWSMLNKPRTSMKALSLGLSLPAVVFAAGGMESASGSMHAALLGSVSEHSIVKASLGLVFAPVHAKSRADSRAILAELEEKQRELESSQVLLADMREEVASKTEQLASLITGNEDLRAAVATHASMARDWEDLQAELESYRRKIAGARAEYDPEQLRQVTRLVERLDRDRIRKVTSLLREGDWSGALEDLLSPFNRRGPEARLICAYLPVVLEQLVRADPGAAEWRLERPALRVVFP